MKKLDASTIGELKGGAIGFAINQAIAAALDDCRRRPYLESKRSVIVQLEITPDLNAAVIEGPDASGGLAGVTVVPKVQTKTPAQAATSEHMRVNHSVTEDGEPVMEALFEQDGLFTVSLEAKGDSN